MSGSRLHRLLPLTGILFVVGVVVLSGVSGNSPDSSDSDAKIAKYLASTSQFNHTVTAIIVLWASSLFFLGFWATLRSRLRAVEGGTGGLSALVFGAGVAATVFNLVGITTFAAANFAAHDAQHSHAALSPDIFRLTQDLGYPIWIMMGIIGSLAAWGTAAVVWKTRLWGRWYAWVSIVVGVICLASIEFFPVLLFGLWVALTSVVMMVQPGVRAVAVRPSPAPAPVAA